jgi:hypothetical protein
MKTQLNQPHPARRFALGAALMASLIASPAVQIASLGTAALALTAGQAMAAITLPGVGVIVKKKPGNAPIAEDKSDDKGMLEVSGLEPGEYSVCFAEDEGKGESCADVKVGKEGVIRAQTVFDKELEARKRNYGGHITLLR